METTDERNGRNHEVSRLLSAIECDSEAIARLLQACGSSRNFGINEQRQFAKLLHHRRHLIAKLETLRKPAQQNQGKPPARTASPMPEKRRAASP